MIRRLQLKTALKLASKLTLVFFASFLVAFTSSSISVADLMDVDLDWTNLPRGISLVNERALDSAKSLTHSAGKKYLNALISLSDNIAFADNQVKTRIYTAKKDLKPSPDLKNTTISPLTAKEILASKSSFNVLINPEANISSFIYYSQHDSRWSDFKIGNSDPIDLYGCGPTALSMLISNLSKSGFTPEDAAKWALENGYYMKGSGSYHNIIVKGANAFGIDSAPYKTYTEDALRAELEKGNVFAALTKPGVFSKASNHFILILGLDKNQKAIIGEPNSPERTQKSWDLDFLLNQLQYGANGGGPLWIVRLAK